MRLFESTWSWVVPLAATAAVFAGVLVTTPPGFRSLYDLALGTVRGPSADAALYAVGAAASLALVALVVLAAVFGALDWLLHRTPHPDPLPEVEGVPRGLQRDR